MSFFEYMMQYLEEDTAEGDLARAMNRDKANFPCSSKNKNKILSYLRANKACIECLETFEECYKLYKESDKTCRKDKHDTRLIAAAPEMYNLLKQVAYGTCDDCMSMLVSVRKLIAHIDGKENEND